jgi:hypothetical protein
MTNIASGRNQPANEPPISARARLKKAPPIAEVPQSGTGAIDVGFLCELCVKSVALL